MPENQYALLQLFRDGGVMMYPLILFSLLALGVIIAKAYMLRVAHRDSRKLLDQVAQLTRAGRVKDASRVAETTPGPVAAILHAGLSRVHEKRVTGADIEKAVGTTGTIELGFLERGLVVLATVSNVAPLTGFLGTVVGMISAFGAIAEAGVVEPALVAGGIKVALITTAAGLTIAIPVNVAYNYFVTRIDKLIVDMDEGVQMVLDMVAALEKRGELRLVSAKPKPATRAGSARSS
ncbi:MAG: MotA/TolQ/ExbB proton channel family protein [Gemmatimonadetes bacterium]|nr:MotA/TolQ/ExbB proton channel family protein [Gemmatimonadota bacterium]